jgi:hypothetical protein
MKFVVQELMSSAIEQDFTPSNNTIVEAIRPHIYRHNMPSGSLQLAIYDSSNTLIATSDTVSISAIGILAFYHGYIRFDINAYLQEGQLYKMKLSSSGGYSFSESAYCGWVNGLDLGKYPPSSVPADSWHYPLDYEIWERTAK